MDDPRGDPSRAGSGRFTKIVKQHRCVFPTADENRFHQAAYGSEWECDCGKKYIYYAWSQRDGCLFREVT